MMPYAEFIPLMIAMAAASFLCRAGGFWFMRFIPITPRLEAALRATPLAVMVGIATQAAASGRPPEIAGLVATILVMRLTRNDFGAGVAGVATLAGARWLMG
jgi:uncharacterized membrane protein